MIFPEMAVVQQKLRAGKIEDIPAAVIRSLKGLDLPSAKTAGKSVAVCVGSRGISRIALIVSACIGFLEDRGFKPFIVPAMGSHGGKTPEGERSVLASLGLTKHA
jgi:hypothetical protein